MVRSEKEAHGYSREAYEHWIKTGGYSAFSNSGKPIDTAVTRVDCSYLIRLEGILSTPKSIQDAANLSESPTTVEGSSETQDAVFCNIDGKIKQSIENWLSRQRSTFKPTSIRLSKAKKDLSASSIYPTLGLQSTLPQHRASSSRASLSVLQDEYPVWYFFYGTLADSVLLARLLSLSEAESPILEPARISGGLIKTWHSKYKALIDGASTDYVHGSAYKVTSKEREEDLLFYETEKYEVVRCKITMASQEIQGLTFRFAGIWQD